MIPNHVSNKDKALQEAFVALQWSEKNLNSIGKQFSFVRQYYQNLGFDPNEIDLETFLSYTQPTNKSIINPLLHEQSK